MIKNHILIPVTKLCGKVDNQVLGLCNSKSLILMIMVVLFLMLFLLFAFTEFFFSSEKLSKKALIADT